LNLWSWWGRIFRSGRNAGDGITITMAYIIYMVK
jgi:hypothetical protein